MAIEHGTYFGFDWQGKVAAAANFGPGSDTKKNARNFVRGKYIKSIKMVAMDDPEREQIFKRWMENPNPEDSTPRTRNEAPDK